MKRRLRNKMGIKDKPIKGLKNIGLYFDGLQSRFPVRICSICGQPVKSGSSRITLTEFKVDRRRKSWDRPIKSRTLLWFHVKCKNKLIKRIESE